MKKFIQLYLKSEWLPVALVSITWFGLMTLNFALIDESMTFNEYTDPIMWTLGICFILFLGILVASIYQLKNKLWRQGVINLIIFLGLSYYLFLHKSPPIEFYGQDNVVHFEQLIEGAYEKHASGNAEEARQDIEEAYNINPYDSRVYLTRANLYRDEKQYDKALVEYAKAIEIDDIYVGWAYNNRGRVLTELGRYEEALIDLNFAVLTNPDEKAYTEYRDYIVKKRKESAK